MSTVLFDPIKTMSKITDTVLVGFSGGKESCVVLDLCFRYFKRVQPYFQYCVPGLSFNERLLRWYENKYGAEIIQVPVEDMGAMFRYGQYTLPDEFFPVVSETDVINYLRNETGIYWVCTGERIDDSIERRARLKRTGTIDADAGRMFPVAYWKRNECYDYIKFKKLYLGKEQKVLHHSLRIFNPKDMSYIKENMPDDYEKITRVFPFSGAIIERYKLKNGEKQISEV